MYRLYDVQLWPKCHFRLLQKPFRVPASFSLATHWPTPSDHQVTSDSHLPCPPGDEWLSPPLKATDSHLPCPPGDEWLSLALTPRWRMNHLFWPPDDEDSPALTTRWHPRGSRSRSRPSRRPSRATLCRPQAATRRGSEAQSRWSWWCRRPVPPACPSRSHRWQRCPWTAAACACGCRCRLPGHGSVSVGVDAACWDTQSVWVSIQHAGTHRACGCRYSMPGHTERVGVDTACRDTQSVWVLMPPSGTHISQLCITHCHSPPANQSANQPSRLAKWRYSYGSKPRPSAVWRWRHGFAVGVKLDFLYLKGLTHLSIRFELR